MMREQRAVCSVVAYKKGSILISQSY